LCAVWIPAEIAILALCAEMELRDIDEGFEMRVVQVAELPGFAVGWDGASAGEDVGVAVRGAGPGAGVSNCVGVEVHGVRVGGVGVGGAGAF